METAKEIRDKLKMKMMDSPHVKVLEAQMLGCFPPDVSDSIDGQNGLVN